MSGVQPRPDASAPSVRPTRLRRLSGKAVAAWLFVCFLSTAILIPMTLRLPRWIEFEIVLCAWWVVWFAVLSTLLYKGLRVADDHVLREPRNWFSGWFSSSNGKADKHGEPSGSWWEGFFWGSSFGEELVFLGIAAVILLGGVWLAFEVAIPVVCFLVYLVVRGMLARVANDRLSCRANLGRSLAWGLLWATAYSLPLVAAVWFIHVSHQRMQGGG